ncbi:MAG: gfo/Idh/MocA family oxidoreductase, partial [Limisphaerales bacterium]
GALFEGSRGYLVSDFTSRAILPNGNHPDVTYYQRRTEDQLIPKMNGFQQEWINACKGNLKTSCDFEYSGNMIEQMLLGLVAYRVGKKIAYDPAAGRVTDSAEANNLLSRTYRDGWTLNG